MVSSRLPGRLIFRKTRPFVAQRMKDQLSVIFANALVRSSMCMRCQQRIVWKGKGLGIDQRSKALGCSYQSSQSRHFSSKTVDDDQHLPKPLDRLLGFRSPPEAGQNTGIDGRPWRERRDDLFNYDKHLVRRKELKDKISKPYYRDWSNLRYSKGKTFLQPPALIRSEKALYFPNFYGQTLSSGTKSVNTTPVLRNKVSIVACFSGTWAEHQTESFVSQQSNPQLHTIIQQSRGKAQLVSINMEDNALKGWLIRLFMPRLRQQVEKVRHSLYFLVRRGFEEDIREPLAMLNSRVGYVYLVDGDCKIRWAGSGQAAEGETDGLAKGLRRLLKDAQNVGLRARLTPDESLKRSADPSSISSKGDKKINKVGF